MDVVDTPKKEIRDMNVMELIERISEALNLWGTNRERTNVAIDECAQKMKDIRLLADKSKLQDVIDNIGIAFRFMEMLTEINDTKVTNKNVKDIVLECSTAMTRTAIKKIVELPYIINEDGK